VTVRLDLPIHAASGIVGPGVRTYKSRRSRMSARHARAFDEQSRFLLALDEQPLDLGGEWGEGMPVIMEIGFGSGSATSQMAEAEPSVGLLAIDIHTPGIGDLLALIGSEGLMNVRVMEADALSVLEQMVAPHALAGRNNLLRCKVQEQSPAVNVKA